MKCSILVPTLGRAHVLPKLIHSIRFATPVGRYEMVFVVDADDENTHRVLHAVPEGDVRIVVSDGTYPEKTIAGYRASEGDLILPTADDVRFYQDWYWLALIEHLHPDWGKRELDATDEKGMRSGWEEDQALFHERSTAWT